MSVSGGAEKIEPRAPMVPYFDGNGILKSWSCPILSCPLLFPIALPRSSVPTTTSNPFPNSIMKLFAPILLAGVALASPSPYFALTVKSGDEELAALGNAKMITRTDRILAIGFLDESPALDALLKLDENGYLDRDFYLREYQEGVSYLAIVHPEERRESDINGPFKVNNATGEFVHVDQGDVQWTFCRTSGSGELAEIYLVDPSVDLTRGTWSCSSAHNLTAHYDIDSRIILEVEES
ncbi:hypothetical protein B0J18DRAFT_439839 [Chaetomium sp. MPI-SDFR-AT-0129]|nr:hypothetical protein B0J18DRAFT_439839 [Chaetomium sp. MPI-SDFR-AT-0129]